MEIKLPYGLKDGEIVTINDVASGLACGCVCPACKKALVARKGKIKVHHFAHYQADDCGGGLETALHLMAKEVIAQSETFTTPEVYILKNRYRIKDATEIQIERVTLESRMGELIPDIVIETNGKKLLIEIVVTNRVSNSKWQRIQSENLPTLVFYVKKLFLDVEDCPLEKQFWKAGRNQGKPHAKIKEDCRKCPYCIEENLSKVFCVAYLKNDLRKLIPKLV